MTGLDKARLSVAVEIHPTSVGEGEGQGSVPARQSIPQQTGQPIYFRAHFVHRNTEKRPLPNSSCKVDNNIVLLRSIIQYDSIASLHVTSKNFSFKMCWRFTRSMSPCFLWLSLTVQWQYWSILAENKSINQVVAQQLQVHQLFTFSDLS